MSKKSVVIVGSGAFGVSTAIWMLESGRYDVTIVDKSEVLPAPDAASTDLNKVIRAGDYSDPVYGQLNIDAVALWRTPAWKGTFHQSGILVYRDPDTTSSVSTTTTHEYLLASGIPSNLLPTPSSIQSAFPPGIPVGEFPNQIGYFNPAGGWAESGRAMEVAIERARGLGCTFKAGWELEGLVLGEGGREVRGVRGTKGEVVLANVTLICTGSWTPSVLAKILPKREEMLYDCVATGQTLAMIQLDEEEQKLYANIPVVSKMDSPFYMFPPTSTGIVKVALHGGGYTPPPSLTSPGAPLTFTDPSAPPNLVPKEALTTMREYLRSIYPELAGKPFVASRLCWYADTPTGDWLIDWHPDFENLVIASGDSGHAFKFTPVLGREILALVENRLDPLYTARWKFETREEAKMNMQKAGADHRFSVRKELDLEGLAGEEDMRRVD